MLSAAAVLSLVLAVGARGARHAQRSDVPVEQEEKLTAATEEHALFGYSVAISADGNTALIGAPNDHHRTGTAWVFTRSGSGWMEQGPPLTSDAIGPAADCDEGEHEEVAECGFGGSVALSANGNTALIGGAAVNGVGGAWVFTRTGSTWSQQGGELTGGGEESGDGRFGRSVALSADGDTALIGGPHDRTGAAWVFTRTGSTWSQQGPKLSGGDEVGDTRFGRSVALSADGDTALIGGPGDQGSTGAAWIFTHSGASWSQQGAKLTGGEEDEGAFGYSVALSADATTALVGGAADSGHLGAAWAFARSGANFTQQGSKLTGAEESGPGKFGYSVALSRHGQLALVGGPADGEHLGAAWSFARTDSGFSPGGSKLISQVGGRRLGTDVALSGDGATALVGGPGDESNLGAVWAFIERGEPEPKAEPEPEPIVVPTAPVATITGDVVGSSSSPIPGSGVLGVTAAALPAPTIGVTGNVAPVSGTVLIKLPGSSGFVPLTDPRQLPFGTIIDARNGRVTITTASPHGGTQTITFYEGEFELTQASNGVVTATLQGGSFSGCRRHGTRGRRALASAARRKRVVRKLWAEGHGTYSTKGNYATGSVLGTRWLTEDLCNGTLIVVATDKVSVTNLVNHRHFTIRAGHSYLAKAP